MRVIEADPSRMIDIPGTGACARPVDIDQEVTGFTRLKSLRIYRFVAGSVIKGHSEVDEVLVFPLAGACEMKITGRHRLSAALDAEGPLRALYMTPEHEYRLVAVTDVLVAYARAQAEGKVAVRALTSAESAGLAEHLCYAIEDLVPGQGPDASVAERLVHVIQGSIAVAGRDVAAGQTVALAAGEAVPLIALTAARVLTVSA